MALAAIGFSLGGCTTYKLRRLKNLPIDGAVYVPAFLQFEHFPDWVRLHSILPGAEPLVCRAPSSTVSVSPARTIAIIDCTGSSGAQRSNFAAKMEKVLDTIERRLKESLHVRAASYTLVPPGRAYFLQDTQRVRPANFRFNIAARFHPQGGPDHVRAAARATAHESYHVAMVIRNQADNAVMALPEETRAAIFSSCVEYEIFGDLEDSIPADRSKVASATSLEVVRSSEAGKQMAARILSNLTGSNGEISTDTQIAEFERLCTGIVEWQQ